MFWPVELTDVTILLNISIFRSNHFDISHLVSYNKYWARASKLMNFSRLRSLSLPMLFECATLMKRSLLATEFRSDLMPIRELSGNLYFFSIFVLISSASVTGMRKLLFSWELGKRYEDDERFEFLTI